MSIRRAVPWWLGLLVIPYWTAVWLLPFKVMPAKPPALVEARPLVMPPATCADLELRRKQSLKDCVRVWRPHRGSTYPPGDYPVRMRRTATGLAETAHPRLLTNGS